MGPQRLSIPAPPALGLDLSHAVDRPLIGDSIDKNVAAPARGSS
jgi:hypothetical protein